MKYTFKKEKKPKCDAHTLPKKIIAKKLYVWLQFLGGLMCFHFTRHSYNYMNILWKHLKFVHNLIFV
jgi:hypothetical protein